MWLRRAGFFLIVVSLVSTTWAANLDIDLASNAASVTYTANLTDTGLEGSLGYLHHTNVVDVASGGLDLVGNASPVGSPLIFGVGGKLFVVDPKLVHANGAAVGLGAHFRYTWPDYNRFAIGGELYFAPSIVTFQDTQRYLQAGMRAEYEVLRNADVYIGYRYVTAAFKGTSTVTLDSSIVVGLSLNF